MPITRSQARAISKIQDTIPSSRKRLSDDKIGPEKLWRTPRNKRLRFSDPPLLIRDLPSTGLTPAMLRANCENSTLLSECKSGRTRKSLDNGANSTKRVFQWAPLRQVLTPRAQRRICRLGLSDEMSRLEREERDVKRRLENAMERLRQEKDAEIERLTIELGSKRSISHSNEMVDVVLVDDQASMAQTQMDEDEGLSLTPARCCKIDTPPNTCVLTEEEAELGSLARELETARREKKELFDAWRSRVQASPLSQVSNDAAAALQLTSPPPDFNNQVVSTLTIALGRATDAARELDLTRQELLTLGFSGNTVVDMIAEMRQRFRSACLALEHAAPESNQNSATASDTLCALLDRVQQLVGNVADQQARHQNMRNQFDALLVRYETAAQRIQDLEQTISCSAADMLHTRMRMQDLEREGRNHAVGVNRLNSALQKYREEVKSLESLITSLERENELRLLKSRKDVESKEREIARLWQANAALEKQLEERACIKPLKPTTSDRKRDSGVELID